MRRSSHANGHHGARDVGHLEMVAFEYAGSLTREGFCALIYGWHEIPGGHFGLLYHPGALFDEPLSVQALLLRQALDA